MFGGGGDVIACPLALDHLKTEGSFVSYGEAIRPTEFALDFDTLRCTAPPGELYEGWMYISESAHRPPKTTC